MKKITLLFASLALSCAAHAAPATDADVDALLAVTRMERMMDQMYNALGPAMQQMMAAMSRDKKLTPEQQRVLDAMPARMIAVMREEMSWEKMRPTYVQIYKEVFTHEEIDGMVAFYKTPAGAATIDKMPLVMQRSMQLTQARMAPMMVKIEAAMRQAVADAQAGK